ncbi:MAG: hypothetical protein ABI551_20920 [Polyangiaceae bacterium]
MSIIQKLRTFIPAEDGSAAMVGAIMALDDGDELECIKCGRARPSNPAVVESALTGKHYSYATCSACSSETDAVDVKLALFEGKVLASTIEFRPSREGDVCSHCRVALVARAEEFVAVRDGALLHGFCIEPAMRTAGGLE